MNCTIDALAWLQERTKVISVSIDARFGLQRVIRNVDSERRKTSNWRNVHRNGDDDVVEGGADVNLAHLLHNDNALLGFVFSLLCHLVIAKNASVVVVGC